MPSERRVLGKSLEFLQQKGLVSLADSLHEDESLKLSTSQISFGYSLAIFRVVS